MLIKSILAYINVFIGFITLLVLYILRCKYNIYILDDFMYIDDLNDISLYTNINYYLSHTIVFYIYGILFGINNLKLITFKIITFEIFLYIIKYCNIKDIKYNVKNIIYLVIFTVILNIISYYFGTLVSDSFYNMILKKY